MSIKYHFFEYVTIGDGPSGRLICDLINFDYLQLARQAAVPVVITLLK